MSGDDVGSVVERVARLRAEASTLAAADLSGVDAPLATSLHRDLRAVRDLIALAATRLLATVEADGRWAAGGARTFPEWVARREGTSVGAARQEATLGRALETDLPATGAAVARGQITLEHAAVLSRLAPTSEARKAALVSELPDRNEAFLLEQASRLGVDDYRRLVRRWAASVDSAAAEREHEAACAEEYLTLSRRPDGVAFQGFLTTEHGAALETALRALAGVPAADDTRTAGERSAGALVALSRVTLDGGTAGGGAQVRPHISVHVSWEALRALAAGDGSTEPAELDSGEPIPASLLARIACDSEISRIVFGPASEVLDVGRAQRTYSGQKRRAVIARDRRCQYPGCSAPPMLGEIHHTTHWARGGRTAVQSGILLCWFHHDLVHRRGVVIRRGQSGEWAFSRADGTPITVAPARGSPPGWAAHEGDRQEDLLLTG
jgi:hypothetical protein